MEFNFCLEPGKTLIRETLKTNIKPLISVVTPFYNPKKEYFQQTYNCMMNQTFANFEWIIVNDGSTDYEAVELLDFLANTDCRIRTVHKDNGGVSVARNLGIRKCTSDIVVFLDSDDLIEPTFLEMAYWSLYFNPEYDFAFSNSVGFQEQEYLWAPEFDIERMKTENFLTVTTAVRKHALLAVDGFDEEHPHLHEDWHLWLKILSKGYKPIKINSYEFWYRRAAVGRLETINTDCKKKNESDLLIEEAAKQITETVCAKTFNGKIVKDSFCQPNKFNNLEDYYIHDDSKTNILFIVPWLVMGGADGFNLDFIRLIDKEKYHVIIATTVNSENGWKQRFREYVSEIYTLPDFLDVENYPEFISYLIETRKINVVLVSNSYYAYYLTPWIKMNYPEVAILDYIHMEELYWRNGGYSRVSAGVRDFIEKTYVCNEHTRQFMIKQYNYSPDKIETIYIGVDHRKYDPENVKGGMIRRKYNLACDQKIVLFPCRLNVQKRPYLMVEIANQIIKKYNEKVVFIVVGDGAEKHGMITRINHHGIQKGIIFAGEQRDMLPFYKDADVTLICSIKEGLALTAYESCSMGVPVITSDVGGQSELVDGTVGKVLPLLQSEEEINNYNYIEREIEQYVSAIEEILFSDCNYTELKVHCRERIVNKFSLDIMIRNMEYAIQQEIGSSVYKRSFSTNLQQIPNYVREVVALYSAYESREQEACALWAECSSANHRIYELERECLELSNYIQGVQNSFTFKIGRLITWIPRNVSGGVRCIQEHGWIYTFKYLFKKWGRV